METHWPTRRLWEFTVVTVATVPVLAIVEMAMGGCSYMTWLASQSMAAMVQATPVSRIRPWETWSKSPFLYRKSSAQPGAAVAQVKYMLLESPWMT